MRTDPVTMDASESAGGGRQPVVDDKVRANVLLVDDDAHNLYAMEEMLRDLGHELVTARTSQEALRHLLDRDFALILMDVQMPNLDGYQLAELIRSRPRCRYVPIIFVTAVNKDEKHVFRGYSVGAVDYVFKPIDPLILKSKVSVFVELYEKTEQVKRQAAMERALLEENLRVRAEKSRSEQALHRREAQHALIIRSLPMALYTALPAEVGRTRSFVSENIEQISGFAADAFADGTLWLSRIHADDRERVVEALQSVGERGTASTEYRWICADGTEKYFLDQAVLVRDRRGRGREVFGTWLDVTDRKRLEGQLHRAQRLEALGRLTGGIAHDFNNMLGIVIGNLDILCEKVASESDIARFADLAIKGALRCANLTRRLLTFARRQPLDAKVIDLGEFVSTIMELLQRSLGQNIGVECSVVPDLSPVAADPAQVEAALLNLIFNARDAMPQGGRLLIRLANVDWTGAARPGDCAPGHYVVLSVSDTGTGMPPEVLARVFEPFFTTKDVGHGTGLGLSTTYGFVKQTGGHVEIDSRVGEGTTVRLYFPATSATSEQRENVPDIRSGKPAPALEGAILVVEDEADVRDMAVATLTGMGYMTLEATDAASALEVIDHHREVALLFTDVMMPGMNGRELGAEVARRRPDLKILYTSGYGEMAVGDAPVAHFLHKPYRAHELASYISRLLGRSA